MRQPAGKSQVLVVKLGPWGCRLQGQSSFKRGCVQGQHHDQPCSSGCWHGLSCSWSPMVPHRQQGGASIVPCEALTSALMGLHAGCHHPQVSRTPTLKLYHKGAEVLTYRASGAWGVACHPMHGPVCN